MIANFLTVLRILVCPPFAWLFFREHYFAASMVFLVGALTDYYDGYLARKYQLVSKFGAFLDPIADKMLVLTGLFVLAADGYIPYWMVWIVAVRDVLMTAPRLRGVLQGKITARVNAMGKAKTALQMMVIFTIFFYIILSKDTLVTQFTGYFKPVSPFMEQWYVYHGMVFIIVLVTVYSGWTYLKGHWSAITAFFGRNA